MGGELQLAAHGFWSFVVFVINCGLMAEAVSSYSYMEENREWEIMMIITLINYERIKKLMLVSFYKYKSKSINTILDWSSSHGSGLSSPAEAVAQRQRNLPAFERVCLRVCEHPVNLATRALKLHVRSERQVTWRRHRATFSLF